MSVASIALDPREGVPASLGEAWSALRAGDPALASPYFHPDYASAVARTSPSPVRVLVEGDTPRGILAVQGGQHARPAGAPMSDYHGVVGTPEGGLEALLSRAGIGALSVGGLVGAAHEGVESVPVCRLDLSGGYEAWRARRDSSYSRHSKGHRRRVRRAGEEVGEPRLVARSRDVDDFNTLIAWKRAQYRESGKFDVLGGWPRELLRDLWERGGELRAELHALYFGDRPAAFDLGLSDGATFHSWIVAYDPELAAYGPGIQLLEAVVEAATALGYATVDLGVGLDGYKRHYTDDAPSVGVGVVHGGGAAAVASRLYRGAEARVEPLARLRRRYGQIAAVEPRWSGRARGITQAMRGELRPG